MQSLKFLLTVSLLFGSQLAGAKHGGGNHGGGSIPNPTPVSPSNPTGSQICMDHGQQLDFNNEQALQWRSEKASGFQSRAFISGTVDQVFKDQTGHRHFSVKVGPNPQDHIEIIYNLSFGQMPVPKVGDSAEACGDYIVATKSNGGYPPSPDGALLHWVHKSPNHGHDDGFVVLNGSVYGDN